MSMSSRSTTAAKLAEQHGVPTGVSPVEMWAAILDAVDKAGLLKDGVDDLDLARTMAARGPGTTVSAVRAAVAAAPRATIGSMWDIRLHGSPMGTIGDGDRELPRVHISSLMPRIDAANVRTAVDPERGVVVEPGSVVCSMSASPATGGRRSSHEPATGAAAIHERCVVQGNLFTLAPKSGAADADADWLAWWLSSRLVQRHLDMRSGGSVIRRVETKDLRALVIPLPDPEVRRRIVGQRDSCHELMRLHEQQNELFGKLVTTIADEVVKDIDDKDLTVPTVPSAT